MELSCLFQFFCRIDGAVQILAGDHRAVIGEEDGVVRVITLSRFNAPFAIEPPL